MYEIVDFLAQNPGGPRGADFGKASPIGLLIIVLLLVCILAAGWDLTRRLRRMRLRREFAEAHDMDPFDVVAVDEAMAKEQAEGRMPRPASPGTVAESPGELRDRHGRD